MQEKEEKYEIIPNNNKDLFIVTLEKIQEDHGQFSYKTHYDPIIAFVVKRHSYRGGVYVDHVYDIDPAINFSIPVAITMFKGSRKRVIYDKLHDTWHDPYEDIQDGKGIESLIEHLKKIQYITW